MKIEQRIDEGQWGIADKYDDYGSESSEKESDLILAAEMLAKTQATALSLR